MEETPVVIVGAGPAGLVLALSLAKYQVHSTILEKELEIGEDPRGVYLAGDAVRVLYQLGIGDKMSYIGQEVDFVNFHKSDFRNPPFFRIPNGQDWRENAVPSGVFQIQPRLEATLRAAVDNSQYCQLRRGCKVTTREEQCEAVIVGYEEQGAQKQIKTSWLIGADGKTGIVRKKFLEPIANVQQQVGLWAYTGTWVAANLKITPPTKHSHPELCFWELGMSPDEVYDLFWPADWHFCSPPGKATACGRFGPTESHYWRHEFAEPDWNDEKDATELLWEHLTPMITRKASHTGQPFSGGDTEFPRDCIEILRCRPFTFCQKVVNKWFHDRTILIGDAAHVFPPFGGQGIACGVLDGDALAWRLAMLLRVPTSRALRDKILQAWSEERRQGVDDSTRLTMTNGRLCNYPETWSFYIFRKVTAMLSVFPWVPNAMQAHTLAMESAGYKATRNGFFLARYGGGGRIAQVYVRSSKGEILRSDEVLRPKGALMALLILDGTCQDVEQLRKMAKEAQIPPSVISEQSLVAISSQVSNTMDQKECYRLCAKDELQGFELRDGYNEKSFLRRFPLGTRYAIMRPDFIIFAACQTLTDLGVCFEELKEALSA